MITKIKLWIKKVNFNIVSDKVEIQKISLKLYNLNKITKELNKENIQLKNKLQETLLGFQNERQSIISKYQSDLNDYETQILEKEKLISHYRDQDFDKKLENLNEKVDQSHLRINDLLKNLSSKESNSPYTI